jgi:hypothetical protein
MLEFARRAQAQQGRQQHQDGHAAKGGYQFLSGVHDGLVCG